MGLFPLVRAPIRVAAHLVGIIGAAGERQYDPTVPLYEFECRDCGHRFEELVGSHVGLDVGEVACPECGAAEPERLMSRDYAPISRQLDLEPEAPPGGQARDRPRRRHGPVPQAARRGEALGQGAAWLRSSERRERLVEVYREASTCPRCPLSETRTKVVFGAGNADADLMFVGEAPGAEEDRTGLPFVGRAGKFLGQLLSED